MEVTREYQLPVGKTMRFKFTITNGETLSQKIGRKVTTCNLSDIQSIMLKDSKTMGTQVVKIKYFDPNKGKVRKFMRLEGTPDDGDLNRFIADLKELIPSPDVWDQSKKKSFKKGDKNVYDMQVTMGGYAGVGLPRKVQIWIIYGIFSLLILPIPLLIYVLTNNCFQVETDDKSITVRKYKNHFFYWTDIEKVNITRVKVRMRNEGIASEELILLFIIYPKNSRRKKFKMRLLEGRPLMKDMLAHNVLNLTNEDKSMFGLLD